MAGNWTSQPYRGLHGSLEEAPKEASPEGIAKKRKEVASKAVAPPKPKEEPKEKPKPSVLAQGGRKKLWDPTKESESKSIIIPPDEVAIPPDYQPEDWEDTLIERTILDASKKQNWLPKTEAAVKEAATALASQLDMPVSDLKLYGTSGGEFGHDDGVPRQTYFDTPDGEGGYHGWEVVPDGNGGYSIYEADRGD